MKGEKKRRGELVYIGVGSNLGDREKAIERARKKLCGYGVSVSRVSELYESKAWGMRDQPDFLNAVFEAYTPLSPHALLMALKDLEKKMGRRKGPKWGPREIDLDILYYGEKVVVSPALIIPHLELHLRPFVLLPLLELAPDFVHPVLKKSTRQLLGDLDPQEISSCWEYKKATKDEGLGF